MLAWVLQISIISVTIIYLVHHLIDFFKSMLTIPKIKDLVDVPSQKYKNLFSQMSNEPNKPATYTTNDLIPKTEENPMKRDLKLFLKKQMNSSPDNTTDIMSLDSNYSPYNNV